MVKLWCEAVLIAPNTKNLSKCAYFQYESIKYMSNPQPSVEAVKVQLATESLVMIRSALEIAGGDKTVDDELRKKLLANFHCFREIKESNGASNSCSLAK